MIKKLCVVTFFILTLVGCTNGEKDECITSLDCGNGFFCVDGKCIESETGTEADAVTDTDSPGVVLPDNGSSEPDEDAETDLEIKDDRDVTEDKDFTDTDIANDKDPTEDQDFTDTDIIADKDNMEDTDVMDEDTDAVDADEDSNDDDTPVQICGNGKEEGTEECDLGFGLNDGSYGGCNDDCTLAIRCGDGKKNGPEFCDSGENNGLYGYCNSDCTGLGERCGDGIENGEEECDDGAVNNGTYGYCNSFCTGLYLRCGDGYVNGPYGLEECDNGENNGTTTCEYGLESCKVCSTECKESDGTVEYCGDGTKNGPEACDEGPLNGEYDHCNANCTGVNSCGDSVVDGSTELCDNNTIACNAITGAGYVNALEVPCNGTCDGWVVDSCVCGTGYEKNGAGVCTDINECTVPSHNCDSNATCGNTEGSFTCECNNYYTGSGTECAFCNTATNCGADCTQCSVETPYCRDNGNSTSQCIECLTNLDCSTGYECNGEGACVDIDECAAGTDNCHEFADCSNTTGSFYCTCKTNYSGNGVSSCDPDTRTGQSCTGLSPNAGWNTASAISQTWSGTEWLPTTSGVYNEIPSTTECRYKCNTNFTWNGSSCEGATQTANCPAKPGGGTVWNDEGKNGTYTQTWTGSSWAPNLSTYYSTSADDCAYKCDSDYHWNGSSCIWNTRLDQACTGLPSNASWNTVSSITQTWNGSAWLPTLTSTYNETSSTSECHYKCNADYHWNGLSCVSNTRTNQSCTGLPANAQWNTVSTISQTWDGSGWLPSTTAAYDITASTTECRFTCKVHYSWDGSSCEADTRTYSCTAKPQSNETVYNTVSSYIQTWTGSAWSPADDGTTEYNTTASTTSCQYKCNTNYSWDGDSCEADTRTFSCSSKPSNSVWNTVSSYTQTWTGSAWSPSDSTTSYNTSASTTECRFKCADDYHWDGSSCVSDTRTFICIAKPPTGTVWNTVSSYTQTWSGGVWTPADSATTYNTSASTTSCRYKCAENYTWNGSSCEADTRTYSCSSKPANTVWNTVSSYTQTWNGSAWSPADSTTSYNASASTTSCRYKCSGSYLWSGSACVECLDNNDCPSSYECNSSNVCEYVCVPGTWNFSNTGSGRSGTIQSWTVPSDGTYKITAYGAQGGGDDGGLGAKMSGDFNLTDGTVIKILVGQRGVVYEDYDYFDDESTWYAGGGGGTYVVKNGATNESGIYVIAGGGGGSHYADDSKRHGSTSTSGNSGDGADSGSGGTNGNGGGADGRGPGGGGFYTNGQEDGTSDGGHAYLNGGAGGNGEEDCEGGFGGGGAPDGSGNYDYGGGGGGYSGGGGGGGAGHYCGGGGGSYNSGTNQSNVGGNRSGHGYVTITRVCE